MAVSSQAQSNVYLKLAFHASESLGSTTPRNMGFMVAIDDTGAPLYSMTDVAAAELIARVEAAGYEVNHDTLEATFYKDNWSGPAGAFEDRPRQGRPAYADNVDLKGQKPLLAPKYYSLPFKTYTASVSFAATTPGTITDAANGLAEFKTGDVIAITGTASNNGTYNVSTGGVAGTIRTTEATLAEGPVSATITVTISSSSPMYDIIDFGGGTYIAAGAWVFKVTNWGTAGSSYLVSVYKAGNQVTRLHVHNGYIYACAGTSAYAYSSDGTTWTASNRGGTDQTADEMTTLRGILHKRIGSNHYQLTASTSTGINGGEAWSSADQIGDTSYAPARMLVLHDSLVFATTNGLENLDGSGNISSLMPGLKEADGLARPMASKAWLNNSIILPLANGSVKIYQEGQTLPASPLISLERLLGISQETTPPLKQDVTSLVTAGDFTYAAQASSPNLRILELEQIFPMGFQWRLFLVTRTTPLLTEIFATYVTNSANAGPVIWTEGIATGNLALGYFLLPLGRDATLDSRSRFGTPGVIYDPWITFGCPEVPKRFSYVEVAVTESTPANFAKDTFQVDAYNEAGTQIITAQLVTMASGIVVQNFSFTHAALSNIVTRRSRLVWTLGNTGASQELETPILLWIRVHAFLLPAPKRVIDTTLLVSASGVGHGVATQEEGRLFLTAMRSAQYPMTLTEPYSGASITVNPRKGYPQEVITSRGSTRPDEIARVILVEQVAGN